MPRQACAGGACPAFTQWLFLLGDVTPPKAEVGWALARPGGENAPLLKGVLFLCGIFLGGWWL